MHRGDCKYRNSSAWWAFVFKYEFLIGAEDCPWRTTFSKLEPENQNQVHYKSCAHCELSVTVNDRCFCQRWLIIGALKHSGTTGSHHKLGAHPSQTHNYKSVKHKNRNAVIGQQQSPQPKGVNSCYVTSTSVLSHKYDDLWLNLILSQKELQLDFYTLALHTSHQARRLRSPLFKKLWHQPNIFSSFPESINIQARHFQTADT